MGKRIKDKDKLWIVYYAAVEYMTIKAAHDVIESITKRLSMFDDSVNTIIVPIGKGDSHVEFYNLEKAEPATIDKLKELMNYAEPKTV